MASLVSTIHTWFDEDGKDEDSPSGKLLKALSGMKPSGATISAVRRLLGEKIDSAENPGTTADEAWAYAQEWAEDEEDLIKI